MDAKNLLRGGKPVVCLAHRSAFDREAGYLHLAKAAGSGGTAVPQISIEIAPDTAAALEAAVAQQSAAAQQTAAAGDTEEHDG